MRYFIHLRCLRWIRFLLIVFVVLAQLTPVIPVQAAAALSITPITWNVIGLDSNNVSVGPNDFPVGARVCNTGDTPATNVTSAFTWTSADPYIALRPGTDTSYPDGITLAAGSCHDFYYEVEITRNSAAYNHTRRYVITAAADGGLSASTPTPREVFVEHLVSQNRNTVSDVRLDGVSIGPGGTMSLAVGGTYNIQLVGSTATNGYNQLESFISLPNTVFRINSVTSTYAVTSLSSPYDRLYADSCTWDNNPLSATYLACVGSDGKTGGAVTTTFNVTIVGGGGSNLSLNTLLYDFSGSSFHYNSDFSSSSRIATISNAVSFQKAFAPVSISAGGTATLTFTLTNLTASPLSGISFSDDLPSSPAQLTVASPSGATTLGCGSPTLTAVAGSTSLSLSNASIAASGTCTVSVTVSAPAAPTSGVYANTSSTLVVGGVDTGQTASANLTVASTSTGSGVCGLTLARWSMDPTSTTTPPAPTFTASDVGTASASASATLTQTIDTGIGSPNPYAWEASGFGNTAFNASTSRYFLFAVDTRNYTGVGMSFRYIRSANGPQDLRVYYGASATPPQTSKASYVPAETWSSATLDFTGQTSTSGVTYFFVYGANAGNNGADATLAIDEITFTGCGTAAQPSITKAFSPDPIAVNGVSTLTFTLSNPNSVALTGASFSDSLPAGMQIAATPNAGSTNCGSPTLTAAAGTSTIGFSGGTIPASGSGTCTVYVDVTATDSGGYANVSGYLSTTESGTNTGAGGSASDTLNALVAPGFSKQFSPNPIYAGQTSVLTFVVTNTNPVALSGIAFSDSLPSGVVVAATPGATHSGCDSSSTPTLTAGAGSGSITFSGGSIAAGGTCRVSVNVTSASVANYANTTSALTTSTSGLTAPAASDTLAVITTHPGLQFSKQVSDSSSGPWSSFLTLAPGSNVYYRLTVENTGDVDLSAVRVTDPGLDLSGCALATPFTLTVADPLATCTVGAVVAQSGGVLNTATAQGTYSGTDYTSSASAQYVGATSGAPALVKQVSTSAGGPWATSISGLSSGDPVYYRFTVINTSGSDLYGPTINDALVSLAGCTLTDPLPDGQATFCVVGPFSAASGVHTNTAIVSGTDGGGTPLPTSGPAEATYAASDPASAYNLSGVVWEDANADGTIGGSENRLFNVTLYLYQDNGNGTLNTSEDVFLGVRYSAADGTYAFDSLSPGSYFVTVVNGVSGYNLVSGTNPRLVTLTTADSSGNNFGYQSASAATLSGSVWLDANGNGALDAGETTGIGSVTISLYTDPNGDGDPADGSLVTSTTTNSSGAYSFSGLVPGDYVLVETDPSGYLSTGDTQGSNDNRIAVTLAAAANSTGNDFLDAQAASLSGSVWLDANGNGALDAGETTGIGSVTISLYTDPNGDGDPADGSLVTSTTTNGSGAFSFSGLVPGDYVLVETDPSGYSSTGDSQGDNDNRIAVTLASGASSSGHAFLDTQPAGISGSVWLDANGNGALDAGETTGIGSVTISVYTDPNGDGDPADGSLVTSTTTNGSGAFSFTSLAPGNYVLVETDPSGYSSTGDSQGGNDNRIAVTLASGASSSGNQFLDLLPNTISGQVRYDTDADGDSTDADNGLAGAVVALVSAGCTLNVDCPTVTTTSSGLFSFSGLSPGSYTLVETNPSGYYSTADSGGANDDSISITLLSGGSYTGNLFLDALSGTIGGLVWDDTDGDGIFDPGESLLSGVTVRLYDGANNLVGTVLSDVDGTYRFTGLTAGTYTLQETDPAGYSSTTPNQVSVTLAANSSQTVNFGDLTVAAPIGSGTIQGVVVDDGNENGVQDPGETVLAGVTITLYDGAGNLVATTTTAADGSYQFTNLAPGAYQVVESDPAGYASTTLNRLGVFLTGSQRLTVNYYDAPSTGPLPPDPAVLLLASPQELDVGDVVVYSLTVGNLGSTDAQDVILTDTLADFLDILAVTADPSLPASPVISGNTVTTNLGTLSTTSVYRITITARVSARGSQRTGDHSVRLSTSSLGDRVFNNASNVLISVRRSRGDSAATDGTLRLPETGFAPGRASLLPAQPDGRRYTAASVVLEIPALGIKTAIVGIPATPDGWDATWLGSQAGYLEGTAFPSLPGNSVISGHVYLANGRPGPFIHLGTLRWGDQVRLEAFGKLYVYEVREVTTIAPNDVQTLLQHEELPWVTLFTCKSYDAEQDAYRLRTMVRAVLVSVTQP
ncbi:MAG: sortase [Anaerolineaceae bacterium]|nr:sortase [Anaerolineaceae bacterium]